MKTIVITGSSSGIGQETSLYFANKGYKVLATARNIEKAKTSLEHPNIKLYQMDVASIDSIQACYKQIMAENSTIDVLLNNAGYGLLSPFELSSSNAIMQMFQTNVFGVMEVIRAFLPTFKKQKSGLIMAVTSIGGLTTMPLNSVYHGTKYAVEGFCEGLSYELKDWGIDVKLIEPGGVSTNFASVALGDTKDYGDYQEMVNSTMDHFQQSRAIEGNYSSAEEVAKEIYEASQDESGKMHYVIGNGAKNLLNMKRTMPEAEYFVALRKAFFNK